MDEEAVLSAAGSGSPLAHAQPSKRRLQVRCSRKGGWKTPSQQLCFYLRERPANEVTDDTFTLQSSKGICAFEGDAFSCGPHVTAPEEFSVSSIVPSTGLRPLTKLSLGTGPGWQALLSRKYDLFRGQGTKRPHAEHHLCFPG